MTEKYSEEYLTCDNPKIINFM